MITGLLFIGGYTIDFKFLNPGSKTSENWLFNLSPVSIGFIGMLINYAVSRVVMKFTLVPPEESPDLVEIIKYPRCSKEAHELEW